MLKFDPKKYLETEVANPDKKENTEPLQSVNSSLNDFEKVQDVVSQLEASGTDITGKYEDWIKIGFAFADAFGSMGESLFHSVSRNYSGYDATACKQQYQKCLQSNNSGATLGTFFHLAKVAGVTPAIPSNTYIVSKPKEVLPHKEEVPEPVVVLPTLPTSLYRQLPGFLQSVTKNAGSDQERDLLLLGGLTVISSCLPNVYGNYDQHTVYPNLFLFVTAPASSGKGRINLCRRLVYPIHKQKKEATDAEKVQYEVELAEYYDLKKNQKGSTVQKPDKPREQLLFIPANSSATGTFELLANNDGKGLIFETEGDTLAQAFKSEHGNYSDGFRKAFHHEQISYYRRTGNEYVDIGCPQLSAVLTGTPDQVLSLMPDAENGLFSRFIFYKMERQQRWRNVFAHSGEQSLDYVFDRLGNEYFQYYQTLESYSKGINIMLRPDQVAQFNTFFSKQYDTFLFLQKTGLEASLFRLGLICYRIIMIITTLRMLENNIQADVLYCEDTDMEISIRIVETLLLHTEHVFLYLPEKKPTLARKKNRKELFLEHLPASFTTTEYKNIAVEVQITAKSAESYMTQFVDKGYVQRIGQGQYVLTHKNSK